MTPILTSGFSFNIQSMQFNSLGNDMIKFLGGGDSPPFASVAFLLIFLTGYGPLAEAIKLPCL
jgi:hypothetical protein